MNGVTPSEASRKTSDEHAHKTTGQSEIEHTAAAAAQSIAVARVGYNRRLLFIERYIQH